MDEYRFELAAPRDAVAIAALSRRLIEAGLPPSWPAERVLCHIRRTDSVVLTARFHGQGRWRDSPSCSSAMIAPT